MLRQRSVKWYHTAHYQSLGTTKERLTEYTCGWDCPLQDAQDSWTPANMWHLRVLYEDDSQSIPFMVLPDVSLCKCAWQGIHAL